MLNLREELKTLKEGKRKLPTVEEYTDAFLKALLNTLQQQNLTSIEALYFKLSGENICVKTYTDNVTNIYMERNKNAKEIFANIKRRFKLEKFYVDSKDDKEFLFYMD